MGAEEIKEKILALVKDFHIESQKVKDSDVVPVSGKVFDEKELQNLVEASLEGWWTDGKWCNILTTKLKEYLGVKYALLVNSGSSANFLAMKSLTSKKLGERQIRPGDEVITVAAGFPTTVNPILDCGAIPVFVDIDIGTYNAVVDQIKVAVSDKTKAIILAHSLGNPFDLNAIKDICDNNNLWLIEDNCDALGSMYDGNRTGTFGDISTSSFYPAHHITTAEGGAIFTDNPQLYKIILSLRDWGRDCWCPTGKDNTCGKRFSQQLGNLPFGYDHKYTYSEIGYNMKMTDLQAAIGVAQMDKVEHFVQARIDNFHYMYEKLKDFEKYFVLPKATERAIPSWFGFLLTIKDGKVDRTKLLKFLNDYKVGTRLLFGGNLTKQPYFVDYNINYRQVGTLENSDYIMENTFWIGLGPLLEKEHIDYIADLFEEFFKNG